MLVHPAKQTIKVNLNSITDQEMMALNPHVVPLHYSAWHSVLAGRVLFVIWPELSKTSVSSVWFTDDKVAAIVGWKGRGTFLNRSLPIDRLCTAVSTSWKALLLPFFSGPPPEVWSSVILSLRYVLAYDGGNQINMKPTCWTCRAVVLGFRLVFFTWQSVVTWLHVMWLSLWLSYTEQQPNESYLQ